MSKALVEVQVGTPAVSHSLLFDTGSSTTWMITAECDGTETCQNNSGYNRTGYNASASSTYEATGNSGSIEYIDGALTGGEGVEDVFSVSSQPNTTWTQSFMAANQSSWFNIPSDGFLGLAFSTISDANTTTMVETLMQAGLLDQPRFGLYYGTELTDTGASPGDGSLTLGGSDEDVYVDGDVKWTELQTPGADAQLWRVDMQYVIGTQPAANSSSSTSSSTSTAAAASGKTTTVPLAGAWGIFDTGAPRISVGDAYAEEIYASIGMNWTAILAGDVIPLCEDFTDEWSVEFSFGNYLYPTTVTLTGDMLKTPGFATGEDKYCWPPFDTSGTDGLFLFGAAFLQKFYTVFDFGSFDTANYDARIGFGELKQEYKPY